jgi:hypothetical protein
MMLCGSIHEVSYAHWTCFLDAMVTSSFALEKGTEQLWMAVFAIC